MALPTVTITAQYGTTKSLKIKAAVDGTTVYGSSGVGDTSLQPEFTTNVEAAHVLKIKDKYALNIVQTVDSDVKLTMAAANIANSTQETTGTITLTNGSKVITGVGTSLTNLQAGDLIQTGAFEPVEIGAILGPLSGQLADNWADGTQNGVAFVGYVVEDFQINRSKTPSLSLNLFHDGSFDHVHLENDNWIRIENAILGKSGVYVAIQANETIATDDCLYVIGKTGDYLVVGVAACTAENLLPCMGFALASMVLNERGYMKVSRHIDGIGATTYPAGEEMFVGDDGKITWVGKGNFPAAGEFKQSIGIGAGNGTILFYPNLSIIGV